MFQCTWWDTAFDPGLNFSCLLLESESMKSDGIIKPIFHSDLLHIFGTVIVKIVSMYQRYWSIKVAGLVLWTVLVVYYCLLFDQIGSLYLADDKLNFHPMFASRKPSMRWRLTLFRLYLTCCYVQNVLHIFIGLL